MPDAPRWWLDPRVVFSALAAVVIVTVLLAPAADPGLRVPNLTSQSAAPNGARGLHDIARRLGWRVERRVESFRAAVDSTSTYAVLLPSIDLTSGEVGVLLDAVRRGAGLLVVPRAGSPIADSLGLRPSRWKVSPLRTASAADEAARDSSDSVPERRSAVALGQAGDWAPLYDRELHQRLELTRPLPTGTTFFLEGRHDEDSTMRPVILGHPLGRGRIVVIADPRVLVNETLRDSGYAALPVRLVEWLSAGATVPLVFAEYHHGYGRHSSMTRAVFRGLAHTPIGRAIGALAIAGLVLLLSQAVRPMPPQPRRRIERRSALEHVMALARAYEQVAATRTAVRTLVRGLRRRRFTGRRAVADADMLRALGVRHPGIAADVERVIAATDQPVSPSELLAVGRSVVTIERTIYQ